MPEQNVNDKIAVIIRTASERTTKLCECLLLQQGVSEDNVLVIQESPFWKALRKSYEAGIQLGKKWTLCVDADVLMRSNSIKTLLSIAESQEERVSEIQGGVLDKFFCGPRAGGIHLYRTSLLSKALDLSPTSEFAIRPEFATLKRLHAAGFPWKEVRYVVGLHDFEQSYTDIFRKCFVHSRKHLKFAELFVNNWQKLAEIDADYDVALSGFASGIRYKGHVTADANSKQPIYYAPSPDLIEKGSLPPNTWSTDQVDKILVEWEEPTDYSTFFPNWSGLHRKTEPVRGTTNPTWIGRIRELGVLKGTLVAASERAERLARKTRLKFITE